MSQKSFQNGDQPVAAHFLEFDGTKLLITPVQAGAAIGYAPQTTWNLLSAGEFPIPTVQCGKRKRRMIRVADLLQYVDSLEPGAHTPTQPTRRPGRPTKEESIRREAEKKGGAA